MFLIPWLGQALAAPVLWAAPPDATQRAIVAADPSIDRELPLAALLADAGLDDRADQAYRTLERELERVRAFETRLDGERIIMADLQIALDAIEVVRDGLDREALFKALAYQGFAVQRYYGDTLATAPDAEGWRAALPDQTLVRPWRDATALAPEREVTAYDIAEAPQRIAFARQREIVRQALPGGLRVQGLPAGATLWLDGRATAVDAAIRVPPGLHYLHVTLDGHVVHAQRITLEAGQLQPVELALPIDALRSFVAAPEAAPPPAAFRSALDGLGGVVYVARPGPRQPVVHRIDAGGATQVSSVPERHGRSDGGGAKSAGGGLSLELGAVGGWLSSGDFYTQDPATAPHLAATVNSAAVGGGVGLHYAGGPWRVGLGVDALVTPGPHHVALTGDRALRVRPAPQLYLGTRFGGLTAGYMLPYHPTVGARAYAPLHPRLALRADFTVGLPGELGRPDGSAYRTLPLYTGTVGAMVRVGRDRGPRPD